LATSFLLPSYSARHSAAVSIASTDTVRAMQLLLALGDATPLREIFNLSPMALGPELDIIPGWD
jgi:hypothetical protein